MTCITEGANKVDNTGKLFIVKHYFFMDNNVESNNVCIFKTYLAADIFFKKNNLLPYGMPSIRELIATVSMESWYEIEPLHFEKDGDFNMENIYKPER